METPTMVIEGTFAGKFARVNWTNESGPDMHPTIEKASRVILALLGPHEGLPYDPNMSQTMFYRDFYTHPHAFVALMRATLDSVTKVEGVTPPQLPQGYIS